MPENVVPRSLRYRLLWLAAIALAPFALAAALAIAESAAERRAETQQAAAGIARALVHSVDSELRRSIAVLDALAQASELERDDLEAFYERARLAAARQPHWRSVSLAGADRRRLFNTGFPFSAPPQGVVEPESLARVIEARAPVVGGLEFGRGRWAFSVRVPVLRDGGVRWVLTAPISSSPCSGTSCATRSRPSSPRCR